MPYFPNPDHNLLYYDDAEGARGSAACFCGKHLLRHTDLTEILTEEEIIRLEDGKPSFVLSCETCNFFGEGPFTTASILSKYGFHEEAKKELEQMEFAKKRKQEAKKEAEATKESRKRARILEFINSNVFEKEDVELVSIKTRKKNGEFVKVVFS